MILFAAVLLAQITAAPMVPAANPRGTVLADKLANWHGKWRIEKGLVVCHTRVSSGDPAVDAVGCRAYETCLRPHLSEITAIGNSSDGDEAKSRRMAAVFASAAPCTNQAKIEGIRQLAESRGGQ
jgi:hypothetical protein